VVLSGYSVSSTTKTGHHDIAEILLKVALKHKKSNKKTQQYLSYIVVVTQCNWWRRNDLD
jgi:hypothetical protein